MEGLCKGEGPGKLGMAASVGNNGGTQRGGLNARPNQEGSGEPLMVHCSGHVLLSSSEQPYEVAVVLLNFLMWS